MTGIYDGTCIDDCPNEVAIAMSQHVSSDSELEFRKLQNAHEVAMFTANTDRLRAKTDYYKAKTHRYVWLFIILSGFITGTQLTGFSGAGIMAQVRSMVFSKEEEHSIKPSWPAKRDEKSPTATQDNES